MIKMKERKILQGFALLLSLVLLANTITALPILQNNSNLKASNEILKNINLKKTNQKNQLITIIYPRLSCPAIMEPGESLDIIVNTIEFSQIYAYIETANEPIINNYWLPIQNVETNETVTITVTIPETCHIEMYNLTIYIENSGQYYSHTQPHSISIKNDINENYSFIHIADLHIGDIRGILENFRETIGWRSVKQCIKEINILSPDFVVITGDLVFGQLYPFEYTYEYEELYSILQQFDVPVYLVPGNHDGYNRILEDGLEFWTKYFGPYYYSFDYGSSHFQAINSYDMNKIERLTFLFIPLNWGGSISQKQIHWIQQDIDNSNNSNLNFMLMHHNPIWETTSESLLRKSYQNRDKLLDIIHQENIDMVIAGHVHYDNVTIINETIFLTTTTPQSSISKSDGYWGYRHIFIENGSIASYNYKEPKYSNPTYKLEIKTIDSSTKEVTNDLEIPITAHIKFLLPKGTYGSQNGMILYQRDNEVFTELYVSTDVEPQNTQRITVTELTD